MNKTKQGYVAPLSDLLVVRFEENIMSPNYGSSQAAGQGFSSSNGNIFDYTDGDDF